MVCAGLETIASTSIVGILAFPTSCFYWFWGLIMLAWWIILASILFFADKDKFIKSDILSALGVSSVVNVVTSLALTLLREELDSGVIISVMQPDVFTTVFTINMIFIVLWLIRK